MGVSWQIFKSSNGNPFFFLEISQANLLADPKMNEIGNRIFNAVIFLISSERNYFLCHIRGLIQEISRLRPLLSLVQDLLGHG